MLYIIWAIINTILFFCFLYACCRAFILLRRETGFFTAPVLVIGILALGGTKTEYMFHSAHKDQWPSNTPADTSYEYMGNQKIRLDKNVLFTTVLHCFYGRNKVTGKIAPYHAWVSSTGLFSGTNWKTESISITENGNDHTYNYSVVGSIEWQLLGFAIAHYYKSPSGTLSFDNK